MKENYDSYYKGWDNDGGNGAKWLSSPTPEQLKNVNCIRYTSIDTLEDGHIADLICSVAVDESDSDKTRTLLVVKPAVYRKIVVDEKKIGRAHV